MDPFAFLEAFRPRIEASWLSRLHPGFRMLVIGGLMVVPLMFSSLVGELFAICILFPLIVLSKSINEVGKLIKGSLFFLMIIVLTNYLFTRQIWFSIAMGMRLISMLILSAAFFASTDATEIGDLLDTLGFPPYISFSFVMALRFIPVLAEDAQNIIAAQESRGLELTKGGMFARIRNMIPILIPLVVLAIRRAQQLAEALESRAFGSGKRTSYWEYRISRSDFVAVLYLILSLSISLYLKNAGLVI
ncbi:MAG TPA: energy-coupling factor transporter transmembrane protein EcfT [Candidatus Korarchaeota archaeon]|nr:energy-coupling factor transporter transmembrane protein EcfT [Candidatus Korarchaeota archaeon]